jgi:cohesin complex subunit SCC1
MYDDGIEGEEEEEATTTTSTSKWHKNTIKVLEVLRTSIRDSSEGGAAQTLSLSSMAKGVSRRTAAGVFFELLQLKTLNFVEINQADCQNYGDIVISAGPKFWQEPPTK